MCNEVANTYWYMVFNWNLEKLEADKLLKTDLTENATTWSLFWNVRRWPWTRTYIPFLEHNPTSSFIMQHFIQKVTIDLYSRKQMMQLIGYEWKEYTEYTELTWVALSKRQFGSCAHFTACISVNSCESWPSILHEVPRTCQPKEWKNKQLGHSSGYKKLWRMRTIIKVHEVCYYMAPSSTQHLVCQWTVELRMYR